MPGAELFPGRALSFLQFFPFHFSSIKFSAPNLQLFLVHACCPTYAIFAYWLGWQTMRLLILRSWFEPRNRQQILALYSPGPFQLHDSIISSANDFASEHCERRKIHAALRLGERVLEESPYAHSICMPQNPNTASLWDRCVDEIKPY